MLGLLCLLACACHLADSALLACPPPSEGSDTCPQPSKGSDTCPPPFKGSIIKRLKSSLFCDYDPLERPVKNREDNVTVNYRNKFEISVLFDMNWQDGYLTWNPKEYENITQLLIPSNEMWFPDIFIMSSHIMRQHGLKEENVCKVLYSGDVECTAQVNTIASCHQQLTQWPFDKQTCQLPIISYGDRIENVDLRLKGQGYNPTVVHKSNDWTVININASRSVQVYPNFTHPQLDYTFQIQRHGNLYAVIVIAPALVTSTLTLLSFWITEFAYRTRLCCTSLLGNIFCLLYIGTRISPTGNTTPNIVLFYRDSMVMTLFALVLGFGVEKLKDRSCNIPLWLVLSASWLQLRGGRASQLLLGSDDLLVSDNDEDSTPKCRKYVTLVNRLAFIVLLITHFIMLIALLP